MSDLTQSPPTRWLNATQAVAALKISRQTLYAYVSRGLIGATTAENDPRRSLYDAADVRNLAERKRSGRSRRAVAASTINFGEPILVSGITRIEAGRLEYRGRDALVLSETATLEEIACLLWQVEGLPNRAPPTQWPRARGALNPIERCIAIAASLATVGRWAGRVDAVTPDAVRLLDLIAWAACGQTGAAAPASSLPMHERLAGAWNVGARAADMIRRALVLLADHELNASTYAARVVASTRAPLGACLLAGLAALSGPLHGGVTDDVRALLAEPSVAANPANAIATRLARGEYIPGFGQRLYPDGDPRAAALLALVPPRRRDQRVIDAVRTMTGVAPNVDFSLVVLEERLGLPTGAAFALFAVGRTVGWIAHALEQWRDGRLIRPRAVFQAS